MGGLKERIEKIKLEIDSKKIELEEVESLLSNAQFKTVIMDSSQFTDKEKIEVFDNLNSIMVSSIKEIADVGYVNEDLYVYLFEDLTSVVTKNKGEFFKYYNSLH
jgi:hypothetical protein